MPAVFVNRDKHLDELRSLLVSVAGGQGAALVVDGGSGMGKTSLLGEFVRRAESGTGAARNENEAAGSSRPAAWRGSVPTSTTARSVASCWGWTVLRNPRAYGDCSGLPGAVLCSRHRSCSLPWSRDLAQS